MISSDPLGSEVRTHLAKSLSELQIRVTGLRTKDRVDYAGDILIQRGTPHGWENSSDRYARIAFVLIDAVRSVAA